MHTVPYTYCLTHIPSQRKYYGVRYKNGCHPSDLWNKYFSSSKEILKLIREDGIGSFEVEIRRTFENKKQALQWEMNVLRRLKVRTNEKWINKSYVDPLLNRIDTSGSNNPFYGKKHSEESKEKMRAKAIGRKGHTFTLEQRQMLSDMKRGKPFSGYGGNDPEVILRRAEINKSRKHKRTSEQRMRMKQAAIGRKWKLCPTTGKRIFYKVDVY